MRRNKSEKSNSSISKRTILLTKFATSISHFSVSHSIYKIACCFSWPRIRCVSDQKDQKACWRWRHLLLLHSFPFWSIIRLCLRKRLPLRVSTFKILCAVLKNNEETIPVASYCAKHHAMNDGVLWRLSIFYYLLMATLVQSNAFFQFFLAVPFFFLLFLSCRMLLSTCSRSCKCGSLCANKPFQNRPIKKVKLIEVKLYQLRFFLVSLCCKMPSSCLVVL